MARSTVNIGGIPCAVQSPDVRRAIRGVLEQIRKRAPDDFTRLRRRVLRFAPPTARSARGVQSVWRPSRARRRKTDPDPCGVVEIVEHCPAPVAIVAHELGHACTRRDDFARREASASGDGALASELCADYYAYKWGFGRDLAKARRDGHLAHHGPPPNSQFARGPFPDGQLRRYRVTPDFFIQFVRAETPPAEPPAGPASRPEASADSGVTQLLIVSREQPHLYDYAVAEFSRVPGLRIIRDRRRSQRAEAPPGVQRRPDDRRRRAEVDALIRGTGSAIVPVQRKKPGS
ncbi:MAG: hypothetical protein ACREJG_08755 [Candidatus Rokuibacteriota bacterium]